MPISSTSLFHFTKGLKGTIPPFESLKKILGTGFGVFVCDEKKYFNAGTDDQDEVIYAIPMVCFCDIPLSLIANHAKYYSDPSYGVFGVGLNHNWGKNNGLNPIIYTIMDSQLSILLGLVSHPFNLLNDSKELISRLGNELKDTNYKGEKSIYEDSNKLIKAIHSALEVINTKIIKFIGQRPAYATIPKFRLFIKPFQDRYEIQGEELQNYNFSNEREWRYIPHDHTPIYTFQKPDVEIEVYLALHPNLDSAQVYEESKVNFLKRRKNHHYPNLQFEADDISFIIVPDQNHVENLIEYLLDENNNMIGGNIIKSQKE